MIRLILAILMASIFASSTGAETWLSVDRKPIRLTSATSCDNLARDDQETVCDCCVIKNANIYNYSPKLAISQCNLDGCQFSEEAFKTESNARSELARIKKKLRVLTIVRIEKLKSAPILPKNGILTGDDVTKILKALNQQGHLSLPRVLFEDDSRLKIKSLKDNVRGYNCGQLFSIKYDPFYVDPSVLEPDIDYKPLYILKEVKNGLREIKNLHEVSLSDLQAEKIETSDQIRGLIRPNSSIARISFGDIYFKLKNDNKTRYFSLLQTAPGQSLYHHLTQFGQIVSTKDMDDKKFKRAFKETKHIFYRVGFTLSKLHQKYAQPDNRNNLTFGKTLTHGDLHSANIFFDSASDTVTLIDNETFAISLQRPISGINDLVEFYMLHTFHTIAHWVSTQLTVNKEFGINDYLWHELWRTLFHGYFAAYGALSKEDFEILYSEFRKKFLKGFSHLRILKSLRNIKDQRRLKLFGPSIRRTHFMTHEINELFCSLHANELKKYENR